MTGLSKKTDSAESRYHPYELETLAVVNAVKRFRHYLHGREFLVVTDCNSLKAPNNKVNLNDRVTGGGLTYKLLILALCIEKVNEWHM